MFIILINFTDAVCDTVNDIASNNDFNVDISTDTYNDYAIEMIAADNATTNCIHTESDNDITDNDNNNADNSKSCRFYKENAERALAWWPGKKWERSENYLFSFPFPFFSPPLAPIFLFLTLSLL